MSFPEEMGPIPLGEVLDGRYLVQRLLGRGSMGLVYLARERSLERDVVIKVLLPKYAADATVAERFRTEAIAMAAVHAENVVQIYSSGDYKTYPYFAMEYVPGFTVGSLIENANTREEQIYIDVVLGILSQVSRGLEAVHASGIVHRDVKPANMLVGPEFKVALTDFGLVASTDQAPHELNLAGTPLYLAPELIRRIPVAEKLRPCADIYSLGVSTYEMLTGKVPFDGDTIKAILRNHLEQPIPKISEARPELSPAFDEVIGTALAKDPAKRYPTCREFIEAFNAAREDEYALPTRLASQRILVADDDERTRTIYTTALKVGFPEASIHAAADGMEALELARMLKPDLGVFDLHMPGLNGLELCAAIRGEEGLEDMPMIVISGEMTPSERDVLKSIGVKRALRKPIELTQLVSLARSHLKKSPAS